MTKRWYVVHTFSGYEDRAKQALEMRIRDKKQEDSFGQILVPAEKVVEVRNGKRREVTQKHFPGYMMIEMEFNRETYRVVKDTPRVTDFVGGANPPPLTPEEVDRLLGRLDSGSDAPQVTIEFERGESVRVTQGPFANFNGVVDEVLEGRNKVKVMVSIFGRATSVELDYGQVEKL